MVMNYILYTTNKNPKHLNECISNIKKVDEDSNIYLISDELTKYKDVISIVSSKVISPQTKKLLDRKIYKDTHYESNPLWEASLIRIFILRDFVRKYQLKDIIHFDNDVLVYVPSHKLIDLFLKDRVNITRVNKNQIVFGYSYFNNFEVLDSLSNQLLKTIYKEIQKPEWVTKPKNEMKLLASIYNDQPDFFNILESYPNNKSKYIFDPAVYGQLIGGTYRRPRRLVPKRFFRTGHEESPKRYLPRGGWLGNVHEVKESFLLDRSKVVFNKKRPILKNKNGKYRIVNLHIHSKELYKYKI